MRSMLQQAGVGGGRRGGGVVSVSSMSTLSREESNMVVSSEASSSCPDESELELGLGLSLGCVGGAKAKTKPPAAVAGGRSCDQYARILTAKDFPYAASSKGSSSSSSSSSSSVTKVNNNNGSCGTKRIAEPPSSPPGRLEVSQVVGWPPVKTHRMNSLVNHAKSPVTKDFFSTVDKCQSKNIVVDKTKHGGNMNISVVKERGLLKTSLFVKVNMDGIPIGRKIDLIAHTCYKTLALVLEDMFKPSSTVGARRSHMEEQVVASCPRQPVRLLDGSSDFVLTYEDKDGDWMLVGDVPWELFLNSVRRLRIMRTAEANGLGTGNSRQCRYGE